MLNELNLTPELLEKAKSATSATELLAFAQENGITLTTEEATTYYSQLHPKEGAISDEELDNVSGGGLCSDPNEKLAVDYVRTNYCGKDPRCAAYHITSITSKAYFLNIPKTYGKLCHDCGCKALIDAHCVSMGWQVLKEWG